MPGIVAQSLCSSWPVPTMSAMAASTEPFELVIGNATLREVDGPRWIGISDGRIAEISATVLEAATLLDASGALVTPSFVNAHMHLDKVYTLDVIGDAAVTAYTSGQMGAAMASIELAAQVKQGYDEATIEAKARRCLLSGLRHGVRHVLAFADVDPRAELRGITPLLRLREEFRGVVDLQVVAFPQDGLLRDPGAEELVWEAVQLGADVVGGIPWMSTPMPMRTSTCDGCANSPHRLVSALRCSSMMPATPHCAPPRCSRSK